jgi:hypothetical protein
MNAASIDVMSAMCLLERYVESCGEGAILAPVAAFPVPADLARFDYDVVKQYIRNLYADSDEMKSSQQFQYKVMTYLALLWVDADGCVATAT